MCQNMTQKPLFLTPKNVFSGHFLMGPVQNITFQILLWEWHLIKTWPKHCFYTETTTFIRFWQNPADTCNVATVVITCTYIGHTHVQTHIKLMFYVFYMSKLCKNTCKNDAQTQITTVDTLQVLHMYNMCNTKTHVLYNFYMVFT